MCIRAPTEGWSATDELLAQEFELAKAIPCGLVLAACPKGDAAVLVADDTTVGDRSAGQVTRQVFQYLNRVALAVGRSLDEDIPIRLGDLDQPRFEFPRLSQPIPVSFQSQLPGPHQPTKTVYEFLAEPLSQQDIIHQVRLATVALRRMTARDPTLALQRRTASRDQRMKVRMMVDFLVSRV